jgi:hypothetical protein
LHALSRYLVMGMQIFEKAFLLRRLDFDRVAPNRFGNEESE